MLRDILTDSITDAIRSLFLFVPRYTRPRNYDQQRGGDDPRLKGGLAGWGGCYPIHGRARPSGGLVSGEPVAATAAAGEASSPKATVSYRTMVDVGFRAPGLAGDNPYRWAPMVPATFRWRGKKGARGGTTAGSIAHSERVSAAVEDYARSLDESKDAGYVPSDEEQEEQQGWDR